MYYSMDKVACEAVREEGYIYLGWVVNKARCAGGRGGRGVVDAHLVVAPLNDRRQIGPPCVQAYFNDTRRHLYALDSEGFPQLNVTSDDTFLVSTRDWYLQTWDGWSSVRNIFVGPYHLLHCCIGTAARPRLHLSGIPDALIQGSCTWCAAARRGGADGRHSMRSGGVLTCAYFLAKTQVAAERLSCAPSRPDAWQPTVSSSNHASIVDASRTARPSPS